MKVLRVQILLLATVAASSAFATSVRNHIQSQYNAISAMSTKKDKNGLAKVLRRNSTSNFEFTDFMQNTLDLNSTVRQNLDQLTSVEKFNSNSNRIIGVKQKGGDLVCTVKTSYDVWIRQKGVKARIQGVSISEDTWTKTIVGWKMKKSKTVKESTLKDGKPYRVIT